MAKKPQTTSLSKLIGNSIVVKDSDESEGIVVPMGAEENRMANMLLAAQMRQLIRDAMKKYKEKEALLTPKELKDLAETAKTVAEFSGTVYSGGAFEVSTKTGPETPPDEFKADFSGIKRVDPAPEEKPAEATQ